MIVNNATKTKLKCALARKSFYEYCCIKVPKMYTGIEYLKELCDSMQEFLYDDNELLIINIPPRHAKSLTATMFVEWVFGNDRTLKFIAASYNEKLSRTFSKAARNNIMEVKANRDRIVYSDIFPNTKIERGSASVDLWKLEGSPYNNYLATSPTSTTTGMGADIILIDDIVKNAYEANHAGILEQHFEWFTDTMYSRLEGKAKVILIMTRWATKDLAGRLIELYSEQERKFKVISKKAYNGVEMLNDAILDKLRYNNLLNTIGEEIVQANYNQHPIDLKGALYGEFQTYKELPDTNTIHAMCDPADTGDDYLCNIIYALYGSLAYVIDVYYTKDGIDITEQEISKRLTQHNVEWWRYENNFGGKAFEKNIRRSCEDMGNYYTRFRGYKQHLNKDARIYSNSTNVTRKIIMPDNWNKLFPKFYKDVTEYQRQGKNEHDDAPDTLTAIVERMRGD